MALREVQSSAEEKKIIFTGVTWELEGKTNPEELFYSNFLFILVLDTLI